MYSHAHAKIMQYWLNNFHQNEGTSQGDGGFIEERMSIIVDRFSNGEEK